MRILLTIALLLTFTSPALAADRYEFDKSHTNIVFFVSHLGFSNMVGVFTDYDGTFTFDSKKPEESTINVTIKPAGIRTSSTGLDEHLQKPDYFNVAQFPEVTFKSTGIKVTGEKTGEVTGNLTMLGVTKPVVLNVTFNKTDRHPYTQDLVAGFSASATVKRSEFGMKSGLPMVGDDVKIMIETELVNLDEKLKIKPDAEKKN
jgi:polyisoprenoid-binding protein YceI